jgi:hypothetical protein
MHLVFDFAAGQLAAETNHDGFQFYLWCWYGTSLWIPDWSGSIKTRHSARPFHDCEVIMRTFLLRRITALPSHPKAPHALRPGFVTAEL